MAGLQPGFQFSQLQIELGGLRLGQVDDAGVHWHCATLDGWESPDVRQTLTEREADHGAYAGPVYLSERVITLAGKAVCPDYPTTFQVIEQIKAAAGLTDTLLTVYETTARQATVRRSGKVLAQRLTDRVVDWSVQVTAADPRLYAVTETSAVLRLPSVSGGLTFPITFPITFPATVVVGDMAVVNEGSFETRPVITIAGPVSQPQITVTGPDGSTAMLTYGGDIAAGDVLVLDTDAHTVLYNGTASRRALLVGSWPVLPPGQSLVTFRAAADSPAATCTITYRSAWM
ncbi:phage distal tail protein [Actinacidiphila sp. bgisy145]|uniref:phage distal tail protein n=1 Tax=Actinacidiphila sp. bgisy145 TaxID=3413792 RepID=UPI003EBC815C